MMKGIQLGGFSIDGSTQLAVVIVFVIYSLLVMGLGLFVKYKSRSASDSRFSDFLTGGGHLNAVEVAMIAATTIMGGGTMISGPGLTYRDGFIYSILCFTLFLANFVSLGTYGKKLAIIRQRLNAQTAVQCLHHRYQSKGLTIVIVSFLVIFLVILSGGQFVNAAKIFGVILGDDAYTIGLIIAAVVILFYSLVGGFKSLAKICVLQGALMVAAVIFLVFAEYRAMNVQYGSVEAAMAFVARTNSALVDARTYTPLQAIGLGFVTAWANSCNPANIQAAMTYDKAETHMKSLVMSCTIVLIINVLMAVTGPIVYALNQNLTNADYSTIYLTTALLPGWLAGIVIAAVFASIQSSVASFIILIAGSLTRDLYKDCICPEADDKKLSRINLVLLALAGILAVIIAANPTQLGQLLLILATGGIASCFGMPMLFGTFWKRATTAGAMASSVGGFCTYVCFYFLSTMERTKTFYANVFYSVHPLIPALLVGIGMMIAVSMMTQKHKVPFGIYRVWFCKDYDEKYTTIYNSCSLKK